MPDISLCRNSTCTLRDSCYRYRAIPSQKQSYMGFEQEDGECNGHKPLEGRVDLLPTKTVDANRVNASHVERR